MASASEADDETLRSIIDAIPGHVFILDRDAGYIVSNQQALDYLGLTHEELRGQDVPLQVVHPDDIDRFIALRSASFSAGTLFETEVRVRGKDGEYRWFLVRIKPLRDASGQIIRWYGIRTEIDARKRAEETIRENEQELRTTIETIPAYVWTNLPDGTIDFISQNWLDYIGLTRDEYLGWRWTENVHPDDVDAVVANYREALATGRWPKDQEVRGRNGKGEYRWFLVRGRPLRGENGEIVRWYGTIVDIEDRKRAEEALRDREMLLVRTTDELQKLKDQLEKENLALKDEINEASMFEEIVGSSDALRRVLSMVSKVAPTESTVLVTGETGTGKELVARAIHKRSDRAARAFVSVSCAAIAPSLVTSELFGYEKGAFTGALQRHLGRFELAEGGTIFLDEVGELRQETRIALLRVLQERTFERVGGHRPVAVDVRVLAATNRDLDAAIAEGSFRQDLFYRLNVFPVHLPALRERGGDIRLLVEYLVARYAQKAGKRIQSIGNDTMDLFKRYRWPGNVRELQNVIERAVILCDGETFSVDPSWFAAERSKSPVRALRLASDLAAHEKTMIEHALRQASGRVSGADGAAAILGMPRQTLESKLKKLGIKPYHFRTS